MNTRDGYRIALGYIGVVAGLGSLIGNGAPSVNGFFQAVGAQRIFEAILLLGGMLVLGAFAMQRGKRGSPDEISRGRRSDVLELIGLLCIGLCALIAAYASVDFSYHSYPVGGFSAPETAGHLRHTLQASVGFGFETGAAISIAFRVARLLRYEDTRAGVALAPPSTGETE